MGEVVIHLMNAVGGEIRESPVDAFDQRSREKTCSYCWAVTGSIKYMGR